MPESKPMQRKSYSERVAWLKNFLIHIPRKKAKYYMFELNKLAKVSEKMWEWRNTCVIEGTTDSIALDNFGTLYGKEGYREFINNLEKIRQKLCGEPSLAAVTDDDYSLSDMYFKFENGYEGFSAKNVKTKLKLTSSGALSLKCLIKNSIYTNPDVQQKVVNEVKENKFRGPYSILMN